MTSEAPILSSTSKNRIVSIDALRGFALAGVCNCAYGGAVHRRSSSGRIHGRSQRHSGSNHPGIITLFFTGKFFALFSILFGLSFSIQMESAQNKGQKFGARFIWRAVLLFVIGYVHQLFYRGDILTIYAVLAPFIIPFYRVPTKWLLITAGLIFLGIPRFIAFVVFGADGCHRGASDDGQQP